MIHDHSFHAVNFGSQHWESAATSVVSVLHPWEMVALVDDYVEMESLPFCSKWGFGDAASSSIVQQRRIMDLVEDALVQWCIRRGVLSPVKDERTPVEQKPIRSGHTSTSPCPDCAHTEFPGRYVGLEKVETCRTCGGTVQVLEVAC